MERHGKDHEISDQQPGTKPEDVSQLDQQRTQINRVANMTVQTVHEQSSRRVKMSGRTSSSTDNVQGTANDGKCAQEQ